MRCSIPLLAFAASLLPNNGQGFVTPNAFGASRQPFLVRLQEQQQEQPAGAGGETPKPKPVITPDILSPFPEAADPMYPVRGPVGKGDFVVSREGPPTAEELSNENLYRSLKVECSDLELNTLVWKGLGYRFDPESEQWKNDDCFPKWREKFPTPPDLIGMQRIYSKEVDGPCLKNNQQLVRSIPADNKQSLKVHLKELGFTGYKVSQKMSCGIYTCYIYIKVPSPFCVSFLTFSRIIYCYPIYLWFQVAELTPNKTRRAQCANWLLFFREELFGHTVEELKERRQLKNEKEEVERQQRIASGEEDEDKWKLPVTEVF
jgi:hypothetical protein